MKINLKLLSVLVIIAFLANITFADQFNPIIQLYNYSASPNPAAPAQSVLLTLNLHNIVSTNCADTISVQIVTAYPLSVSGIDTQYIDRLCMAYPVSKGTVNFEIPVDSLAQSGTYPITVLTNYEKFGSQFSATNTINLVVKGTPNFTASVTSSNPVDLYPGDAASMAITYQNLGGGPAESVSSSLYSTDPGIEVKWAGSTQELGEIRAKTSASATYQIDASKNLSPGNYALVSVIRYAAENGTYLGNQTFSFILPVKVQADFDAKVASNATLLAGRDEEVGIVLKNTGSEEAKKLQIQIQPVFPFSTDGTVRYVDSLMPGKEVNLTYTVHVDSQATSGQQITGMYVQYQNPQGTSYSKSIDFSMNVRTPTFNDELVSYWYVFALIGLILLISVIGKIKKTLKGKGKKDED